MERVLAVIHLHMGWHETGRPAEACRVLGRVGIGAVHTPRGEDAELARPHHHMDRLRLVWLPVWIELQFVVIVAIEAGLAFPSPRIRRSFPPGANQYLRLTGTG